MGCIPSRHIDHMTNDAIDFDNPIFGVSYQRRTEKVSNQNADNKVSNVYAMGISHDIQNKSNVSKRQNRFEAQVTPSKLMEHDGKAGTFYQNNLTGSLLSLSDITQHGHDWSFPRWRAYKKCTFCNSGCACHSKNTSMSKEETKPTNKKKENKLSNKKGERNDKPTNRKKQNNEKIPGISTCLLTFADILAVNALDLTAPASDALLKNRKNAWVQLAGHPGSFAPAGPHTIWKKRLSKENNETVAYQQLMEDQVHDIVPHFYREVEYNGDFFIEIEDLLQHFHDPNIMDIKMGTRTFMESEVKNPVLRKDLYEKMIKLSHDEPTQEEHEQKAITKLRYMQFREKGSSTSAFGFRCEAIRLSGYPPDTDLKKVKTKEQVMQTIAKFLQGREEVRLKLLNRLHDMREKFAGSNYFKSHEIIGSSLLIMYDHNNKANIWMIDFAKTQGVDGRALNHRDNWVVGNHEDGYLLGIDNLYQIMLELDLSKYPTEKKLQVSVSNTTDSIEQIAETNCIAEKS